MPFSLVSTGSVNRGNAGVVRLNIGQNVSFQFRSNVPLSNPNQRWGVLTLKWNTGNGSILSPVLNTWLMYEDGQAIATPIVPEGTIALFVYVEKSAPALVYPWALYRRDP